MILEIGSSTSSGSLKKYTAVPLGTPALATAFLVSHVAARCSIFCCAEVSDLIFSSLDNDAEEMDETLPWRLGRVVCLSAEGGCAAAACVEVTVMLSL